MHSPMAALGAAGLALSGLLTLTPVAMADPDPVSTHPYVDHVEWAKWGGDLSSLRVYPSALARRLAAQPGTTAQADEAWAEVLALSPDADVPGMRAQFLCHWTFAEIIEPGKTSWNLEPWRPQVSPEQMVAARCNPGGAEEPF